VNLVPWKLNVKWKNCLHIIRNFRFRFSHIYREGNTCADKLANADFFCWWVSLVGSINYQIVLDRVSLKINLVCLIIVFANIILVGLVYVPNLFFSFSF
jgi:hypothetical protein